ncbi:hypothetical protein C8Q80DRAFT_1275299 [Daedaleopsis nitida]|nr:hypothetical protein C8Q80DRAFT_1275299 [Daedaleopsis nitida]
MQRLLFPLNDTVLVALPAPGAHTPTHVAQITVKTPKPYAVETITTYYLVRHDMSELILKLVIAHNEQTISQSVVFEDLRYTLHAERVEWTYGKKVHFQWGDEELEACQSKWTFLFDPKIVQPEGKGTWEFS